LNLASLVESHPGDRRALCDSKGWIDWDEVRRRASKVASGIGKLGVGAGDLVAIAWPTSTEFVVAYLGVLAAGAVAVPLNPASPPAELEREIALIDPAAIICDAASALTIAAIGTDGSDKSRLVISAGGEWEKLFDPAGDEFKAVDRAATDTAVLLFTSGTSSSPRVAVLTHGNLVSNLRQMLEVPGTLLGKDDIGLAAVPFFHVFGLNVVLGMTIATGAGLVCEERFDPAEALRLVVDRGVTVVAGAPPMYADWADLPDAETPKDGFSKVRLLVSGAAALSPELGERFSNRFGTPIWQGYGLTETSPAVSTSVGLAVPRPGSVGRPLPGVELRLVDESGEDALTDDPGEIWVRGPNVFAGYWRDEESTANAIDPDGWFHTGDVGVLDDEGELYVVDRLKDIIIVSGFNVIPAEVERVIRGIDGVKDVVVVGRANPRSGESVEAVVVPDTGSNVTSSDIVEACRAHLAHYKVPETVRFVDSLPHGLAGKALRRFVRDSA